MEEPEFYIKGVPAYDAVDCWYTQVGGVVAVKQPDGSGVLYVCCRDGYGELFWVRLPVVSPDNQNE